MIWLYWARLAALVVTKLRLKPTRDGRPSEASLRDPRPLLQPRLSRACAATDRFVHIQTVQARLVAWLGFLAWMHQ